MPQMSVIKKKNLFEQITRKRIVLIIYCWNSEIPKNTVAIAFRKNLRISKIRKISKNWPFSIKQATRLEIVIKGY